MADTNEQGTQAVQRLLATPGRPQEDNIRQDIGRLLDSKGIDNLLTYATPAGPADLYLPGRRTIIETKRRGAATDPDKPQAREGGETPREQLERYLRSETRRELEFFDLEGTSERPWIGIVTDGQVWHAWRYPHQRGAVAQEIFRGFRPESGDELVTRLEGLLGDDPLGKPWIPERPAEIFAPYRDQLDEILSGMTGARERRTRTKQQLWLDLLRTSSMAPENETRKQRLFVAHSFLITLARGVVHTLSNPDRDPEPGAILKEGFPAWIVDSTRGGNWARKILEEVHGYEWRRRPGDVLRSVYEAFIDDDDRKIFGEYYTPDWLAELLVHEVCDEEWCNRVAGEALLADETGDVLEGRGVLDPACGSGTFLYHAARRILGCPALQEEALDPSRKAGAVARLVCGLDIHPIAVEIARATVLRALPVPPPSADTAIQVYQGDSLMTQPDADNTLFTHTEDALRFTTPKGSEIFLPKSFARHRRFGENLGRLVEAARTKKPVPEDVLATVPLKEDRNILKTGREQIEAIIGEEGNSVWSWYIANVTAPVRLSERKVDRIVANPPWVTMAEVQVQERKDTLEAFSKSIGLWDGGRQAPHHDIAQLFVKRCRERYLANPKSDPAAWLVKKTALSGGHWARFRKWYEGVGAQTLDLEKVRPFGGGDARRCCALFDRRACSVFGLDDTRHLVAEPAGGLEGAMSLSVALGHLRVVPAPEKSPQRQSAYASERFRQGATISPAVLTKVASVSRPQDARRAGNEVEITTKESAKSPWNGIPAQKGTIPETWLRELWTSNDVLPFAGRERLANLVLPVDDKGRLLSSPGKTNDFWKRCEELWAEHRSRGNDNPDTLRECIDYRHKLSRQLSGPEDEKLITVLYPRSGDIMRSARIARKNTVVDSTLYYWRASSENEAAYLVALLNAPALERAFRDSRGSGRDFHTYPWKRVPIPRYSRRDGRHVELARLARRAEKRVARWMRAPANAEGLQQVGLSKRIRRLLEDDGTLRRIDEQVAGILPKHAAQRAAAGS